MQNLYDSVSCKVPGARYFLDKTPRYHLIAGEIINLFPDAKFVFLWRHPLSLVASIIETFGYGHWQLYDYKVDLFDGFENLLECQQAYGERILSVRYEKTWSLHPRGGRAHLRLLGAATGREPPGPVGGSVAGGQDGGLDWNAGIPGSQYCPLEKWRVTLGKPFRKHWALHYLRWIGRDCLGQMGYALWVRRNVWHRMCRG